MTMFPKDCWDKDCTFFEWVDMSVDDIVCICQYNGMECDECDEDYVFLKCPKEKKT